MKEYGQGVVRVGDTVTRAPTFCERTHKQIAIPVRGRVAWIHPRGRFHTVEFGEEPWTVRECFAGVRRQI